MVILKAQNSDLEKVRSFYTECGYGGGAEEKDVILMAMENDKIIGVVRLCTEFGSLTLRGMQISKDFQKRGIGKKLLESLNEIIGNDTCYCLPHDYLEKFYEHIGFRKIKNSSAPPDLQQRFDAYKKKGYSLIIMKKWVLMK